MLDHQKLEELVIAMLVLQVCPTHTHTHTYIFKGLTGTSRLSGAGAVLDTFSMGGGGGGRLGPVVLLEGHIEPGTQKNEFSTK